MVKLTYQVKWLGAAPVWSVVPAKLIVFHWNSRPTKEPITGTAGWSFRTVVAALLVADPEPFVTLQRYCEPLSPSTTLRS
jgi:hypothetical protein